MTDTLPALTERREQIQALILDKQLDDVDNEIKTVEKAQRA